MDKKTTSPNRKEVLVVVYYFPPMGSSGVQRPLKLVKYLRDYGWEPVVLVPKPGAYSHFDDSLDDELRSLDLTIYRVHASTPFHTRGIGSLLKILPEPLKEQLRRFSGNYFLPDNKTGWIEPALTKADEIWPKHTFKAIFSTAPPYSNHIIAQKLKEKYGIAVMMDFRDDWTESHLISYKNESHKQKMLEIEQEVVASADLVTAINQPMLDSLKSRSTQKEQRFELLNQGYDPADFENLNVNHSKVNRINILYNGIFYGENQPDSFLKGVSLLLKNQPTFRNEIKLTFQGGIPEKTQGLISELNLSDLVDDRGYLPHNESVQGLLDADLLWFIVGHTKSKEQVLTGKLFEYIGSGKPILGLVPEGGAAAVVLEKYGRGWQVEPHDPEKIAEIITILINHIKAGKMPEVNQHISEQYNRKVIAGEAARLLDSLLS